MARNIFIVNATQTVVSQAHPEGLFSVVTGYPKNFDSNSYSAEAEPESAALRAAKSEYFSRLSANYGSSTRAMWTVTLEQADGRTILRESEGAFPDMTPAQNQQTEPEE